MNDISSLANSLKTTFGLSCDIEYDYKNRNPTNKLVAYVDLTDPAQSKTSDYEAKKIFDMVTQAFVLGGKSEHHYCGATYEIDVENLTIIEHIDMENRGEWL